MISAAAAIVMAVSVAAPGGIFGHRPGPERAGILPLIPDGGRILPPGPGDGWGFPNGNPDGYGWADYGTYLPLGGDRTPDYFAPRYLMAPPQQILLPQYFNPYVNRGQRYLPYANCGGWHPAGGPPMSSAAMPVHPYNNVIGNTPRVAPPVMNGRVESPPVQSGGSGLIP